MRAIQFEYFILSFRKKFLLKFSGRPIFNLRTLLPFSRKLYKFQRKLTKSYFRRSNNNIVPVIPIFSKPFFITSFAKPLFLKDPKLKTQLFISKLHFRPTLILRLGKTISLVQTSGMKLIIGVLGLLVQQSPLFSHMT